MIAVLFYFVIYFSTYLFYILINLFTYLFLFCFSEEIFTVENANDTNSSSIFLNRLKLNHKKLCGNKGTTVVLMNDYSILEVEQLLMSVLGMDVSLDSVALMVHKLSGGNPFWCKEMALFIHTTGAGELTCS